MMTKAKPVAFLTFKEIIKVGVVKMTEVINNFRGENAFLSNFTPCQIVYEGVVYPTVEHAFQGAKCKHPEDKAKIAMLAIPALAKKAGRRVDMRVDWNEIKVRVMKELLTLKFADPELRKALLKTGNAVLIEGNTWNDTFWGVCDGKGENYLGRLLMEVRKDILKEVYLELLSK